MSEAEVVSEPTGDIDKSDVEDADDKQDNDSGIQKDEKDGEDIKNEVEKD